MSRKLINKKNNRGVSLAEMLIVVAILLILMAVAVPSVITIQRNLRQTELDAKAEMIYVAVQNKLSKMKAGGNTAVFQVQADNGNGVYKLADIPRDADQDVDNILPGDICYFTSTDLNNPAKAASIIMDQNTVDEGLLNNHWVIEFNPKTSVVYAVFYSEDLENCAKKYVSDFADYDMKLRFKQNRAEAGSKVGYYGGGSVGFTNEVTTLTPVLNIVNNEKLTVNVSCTLPISISDYPVFVMKFEDTAGQTYIKYYAFWQCNDTYKQKINADAQKIGAEVDYSPKSMQKVGSTFSLSLVLDDLTKKETRFVNQYGEKSNHTVKLKSGTPLKVTVTAKCPGNYTITQNLSDSKITNSLFSDANCKDPSSTDKDLKLNTAYGTTEDNSAEIHYARHLQNLDESSGVNEQVKFARQSSDITLAENAGQIEEEDWYETYSDNFFNGLIVNNPNFKPIKNSNLVSYNGEKDGTSYRIMNLTVQASTDAGLFELVQDGQTLKNIVLTGAKVTSTGDNKAAGALVGNIKGNAVIDHCQVFLTPADINGKTNRNVWISGKTAGGLVGMVSSGNNIMIQDSGASTVVGEHQYDAVTATVTVFDSNSVGGLIGQVSSETNVKINSSYADGYLVGKTTGGLVGTSEGNVSLESCYAAGFMTYETEGAGLVFGKASLSNSYSVVYIQNLKKDNLPYFAVAKSGTVSGNVYFSASTANVTETESASLASIQPIGTLNIQDMAKNLGVNFQDNTASSIAYNLMGQTLSTYSYPVLKKINHYGDWQADFQVGALVYYEMYSDGTYGFYGANVDSTLKNDPKLTVYGDGYGVVYRAGGEGGTNLPKDAQVTIGSQVYTLIIASAKAYPVKDGGNNYWIYPFPKEWVNTENASPNFYLKADILVSGSSEAEHYYFNPHFAKSVVYLTDAGAAMPVLNSDSTIAIRTARHLYMLSEYYETYAAVTAPCTYLQERNIAYKSYYWAEFSLRGDGASTQSPIAGGETTFKAIYDGQCNWITDVSFTTDKGLYVGFVGHNEGTLKNIVLRASYEEGSDDNYYVGRSGDIQNNQSVYMGVLTGKNESTGRISNCAVAGYYIAGSDGTIHAYQNSYLYAGGLVGTNVGNISSSAADTPTLRLSSTYANVSLGGFAGNNAGIINNCYTLGHIEVAFAKGGTVSIAGFAGKNSAVIRNSYCATALTASGDTTTAYGFAPAGGSVSNCRYLNNGTYSYVNHMHSFNFDKGVGTSTLFSDMRVTVGSSQEAKNSYDFNNTQTNSRRYPFRAVVTDAEGKLVHFGDWLDDENMGNVGIFYWEKETNGSNNGYHFTYLGTVDGEAVGGTSLCTAHDDGGVISEYGYGYFELNKGSVTALQVSGAEINGSLTFDSKSGVYNETASKALEEQMNLTLADGTRANYYFYAFTTRTKAEADAAKSGDDNGNYVCLSGSEPNSTWTLKYKSATEGTSADYKFTVSPFFANAMSMEGGKTITATDGTGSDYSKTPGTEENQYEVRSIEQLQFINWNYDKKNTSTLVDASSYKNFNYLMYAKNVNKDSTTKVTKKSDITDGEIYFWRQSHDVDGTVFSNYTPIAGNYESTAATPREGNYKASMYAWFGGNYNGESYKIQNVKINSNSFAVGLFGVTVGANMKNMIMYSDNDTVIRREETSLYPDKTGAYSIGGLIGVAYDYDVSTTDNFIENCAIAGYRIEDGSSNRQGLGEANVGGLLGVANVHLKNCSAVTNIVIDSTHQKGTAQWGIFIRVGGLTGAAQGKIQNCYSGGSAKVSSRTLDEAPAYSANTNKTMQIYIGGIAGSAFTSNYSNFTANSGVIDGSPVIQNCYTYFQFPNQHSKIQGMFTIASLADRINDAASDVKVTIDNCFYLSGIRTSGVNEVYNRDKPYRTSGTPVSLNYNQMTDMSTLDGLLKRLNGQLNSGSNRLEYGAGYSNVTTTEGNVNVPIDGKYSYPGTNAALEGKNYPFPAIVQQKDLTFSTASNPKYVYVHYGDWPIDGPYWEKGRDSMDIFQDMEDDGYAVKKFYLNPNGVNLEPLTKEKFKTDNSIAVVKDVVPLSDGRYEVTILAINTGTTSVTLEGTTAEFTLEVTANITISASTENLKLKEGEKGELVFTASSIIDAQHDTAKNYETLENTSWSITRDRELVSLTQKTEGKNQWEVTRDDMGKVTLSVTFSYQYPNLDITKEPAVFSKVIYVNVLQPDTIGLSDGNMYNVAYIGDTNKIGKNASYSVDKPTVTDADFFVFLNADNPDIVKLQDMRVHSISVGGKKAVLIPEISEEKNYYQTSDGYYLGINQNTTQDDLYQYLSGEIYYLTSGESLEPIKNVPLHISVSSKNGSDVYEFTITLQEVKTRKALTITYLDEQNSTNKFERNILSGEQLLPTQADAIAESRAQNSNFVIPEGKMLAGWKIGEDETIYEAGTKFSFATNVTFYAVFKDIEVVLYGNGGTFNGDGTFTVTSDEIVNNNGTFYLSEYSNTDKENHVSRIGYDLKNWNTTSDGTGTTYGHKIGDGPVSAATLAPYYKLYAQWNPKAYIVQLQAEEGTNYQKIGVTYDSPTISLQVEGIDYVRPAKKGYKLVGWANKNGDNYETVIKVDEESDGLVFVPGIEGFTDESGKWIKDQNYTTLYARWREYQLTLENGVEGSVYTQGIPLNSSELGSGYQSMKDSLAYEEGWTLDGWYTEKSSSGKKVLDADGKVVAAVEGYSENLSGNLVLNLTSDKTLYACWKKENIRYVKTDQLDENQYYLLVNTANIGDGVAFGTTAPNTQSNVDVQIKSDSEVIYIDTDMSDKLYAVFEYSSSTFGNSIGEKKYFLKLNKYGNYYYGHTTTDKKNQATTFEYEGGYLKSKDKKNSGYFYYDGSDFVAYSSSKGFIYLYKEEIYYDYSFADNSTFEVTIFSLEGDDLSDNQMIVDVENDLIISTDTEEVPSSDEDPLPTTQEIVTIPISPTESTEDVDTPDTSTPEENNQEQQEPLEDIPQATIPEAILPDEQTIVLPEEEGNQEDAPSEES